MGSLSSRPKIPAQPRMVYASMPSVPAPASQTPSGGSGGGSSPSADPPQVSPEQAATEARTQSLLGRSRGRFGTVLTGFRGLLGLADTANRKKTLLGE